MDGRMRRAILLCGLTVLCLWFCATCSYCWQEEYEFVLEWGSAGSDTGQLDHPRGMCTDGRGHIFVCEYGNKRVQEFDLLGKFIMMFGDSGAGPGQFMYPSDVVVDDSGYIYVADPALGRIQKFDGFGNLVLAWGDSGLGCRGIAIDSLNYLYVTDQGGHSIRKFTTTGDSVARWFGPDSLRWSPVCITVHEAYVYAHTEYFSSNIQEFDTSGGFVLEWSGFGFAPEENAFIEDLATDDSGSVYASETWNDRCQKFDRNGRFVTMWGVSGHGPGQFDYPWGIAIDRAGNVYVGDAANNRIQKFRKKI
jgi:DNA-binding beta-propeller fold protein YncE